MRVGGHVNAPSPNSGLLSLGPEEEEDGGQDAEEGEEY